MSRIKHGLWIAALILAIGAPAAGAEETSAEPGLFEHLIAQVIAVIVGEDPAAAMATPPPGLEPELGELAPVGG